MQQLVTDCPDVVHLADPRAIQPGLTGAKAASLARAANAGLPVVDGFVLTTGFDLDRPHAAWLAWSSLSADGAETLVVRSSSTAEDGEISSMAGLFTSVLDVAVGDATEDAVREVLESRLRSRPGRRPDGRPRAAPGHGALGRRALRRRSRDRSHRPPRRRRRRRRARRARQRPRRRLDRGARRAAAASTRSDRTAGPVRRPPSCAGSPAWPRTPAGVFGGPQDIEWAVDADDRLHLLQSRPITTLHGPVSGPVLGAGPLAESFPDPLAELEHDLWIEPLRQGLREALTLTAAAPARAIGRSPSSWTSAATPSPTSTLLGATSRRRGVLAKLDPRPPARRLRASWRVGRLTAALPALARDVVEQVDADLAAVPAVGELSNSDLLAVLANARAYLAGLTGHEALAGLLLTPGAEAVTAASVALAALGEGATEGVPADELVATNPVVLALVPPSTGTGTAPPGRRLPAGVRPAHRRRSHRRRPGGAPPPHPLGAGAHRRRRAGARPPARRRRRAAHGRQRTPAPPRRAGRRRRAARPARRPRRPRRAGAPVPAHRVPPRRRRPPRRRPPHANRAPPSAPVAGAVADRRGSTRTRPPAPCSSSSTSTRAWPT